MMKPKFDDVIDYIKAGENDSEMQEMLRLHPDGRELLKQARFICKVLQDQYGAVGDGGITAEADMLERVMSRVVSVREESAKESYMYDQAAMESSRRQTPPARYLIEDEGRRSEDLGTLEIADDDETVSVTYQASDSVMMRYGKPFIKYLVAQADIDGIEIRGRGITMSLSDSIPTSEPMAIRVAVGLRQMPARGLKLIFMPESGPFVQLRADDEGIVQLPAPVQPGTLRIDEPEPQLLRIKIREN